MPRLIIYISAIALGAVIGFSFGILQQIARRHYLKKQNQRALKNGAFLIPGSMIRIALFLIVLAAVQLLMPNLFQDNAQWLVSFGVIAGYGWALLREYRKRTMQ